MTVLSSFLLFMYHELFPNSFYLDLVKLLVHPEHPLHFLLSVLVSSSIWSNSPPLIPQNTILLVCYKVPDIVELSNVLQNDTTNHPDNEKPYSISYDLVLLHLKLTCHKLRVGLNHSGKHRAISLMILALGNRNPHLVSYVETVARIGQNHRCEQASAFRFFC